MVKSGAVRNKDFSLENYGFIFFFIFWKTFIKVKNEVTTCNRQIKLWIKKKQEEERKQKKNCKNLRSKIGGEKITNVFAKLRFENSNMLWKHWLR